MKEEKVSTRFEKSKLIYIDILSRFNSKGRTPVHKYTCVYRFKLKDLFDKSIVRVIKKVTLINKYYFSVTVYKEK